MKVQDRQSWPLFGDEERAAVDRVLRSGKVNYWTGDECHQFEQEFASKFNSEYGISLFNGTVSLELALRTMGVGPGDDVIVTPRSFVASASAIVMVGARPVFADVSLESQNITAESIESVITSKTRAVVAVHLAGWPCEMPSIMEIAREYGLLVLEDCAQAHGAIIDKKFVGSFGDFASFSFCQDKIMTTGGEGGMLLTASEDSYNRARAGKDHGKNFARMAKPSSGREFRYVHDSIGTNYRMTEMQAALGRVQLSRLEKWIETRNLNAAMRSSGLSLVGALRIPRPPGNIRHSYYKYYAFIESSALRHSWSRDRIINTLSERGVKCFSGSCPEIYLEQAFKDSGQCGTHERLPNARKLGESSLMFLVDPTISAETIERENEQVRQVIGEASRK